MGDLLGFCSPNSDNLSYTGMTATWSPDGGGGVLTLNVPAGASCGGADGAYSATLTLGRHYCSQKFRFEVSGNGSHYNTSPSLWVINTDGTTALKVTGTSGGSTCSSIALAVAEGTNPVELTAKCGTGSFSVFISGSNSLSPALTITVTVTLV